MSVFTGERDLGVDDQVWSGVCTRVHWCLFNLSMLLTVVGKSFWPSGSLVMSTRCCSISLAQCPTHCEFPKTIGLGKLSFVFLDEQDFLVAVRHFHLASCHQFAVCVFTGEMTWVRTISCRSLSLAWCLAHCPLRANV